MANAIDKLFKGYTVREIEEILFKVGLKANKNVKKPIPEVLKSSSCSEKRVLAFSPLLNFKKIKEWAILFLILPEISVLFLL